MGILCTSHHYINKAKKHLGGIKHTGDAITTTVMGKYMDRSMHHIRVHMCMHMHMHRAYVYTIVGPFIPTYAACRRRGNERMHKRV